METGTQKRDLPLVAFALGLLWSGLFSFTIRGMSGWIFVTAILGGSLGGLIASNPQRFGPKTVRMFVVGMSIAMLVILAFIYIQEGGSGLMRLPANEWVAPLWFLFQLIGLAFGLSRNSDSRKR